MKLLAKNLEFNRKLVLSFLCFRDYCFLVAFCRDYKLVLQNPHWASEEKWKTKIQSTLYV